MPRKIEVQPNLDQLKLTIAAALRRAAINPGISGYKPQPHQIPFHDSAKKIRLFVAGNRVGKTVAGGAEAVKWLTGHSETFSSRFPPPVRGRCVGIDFDNGINRIMLPEIARWMPQSFLINGSWEDSYSKGERLLRLTNGSTIEFMSNDQDVAKFAGTSRHFVWFDEQPNEDIYNECLARLVDTGGCAWMTLTPLNDMSWTRDRLYEPGKAGDPNIDVFEASTTDNAYINAAELDILTEGMSPEEKEARLHGTYLSQSGTIYSKVTTPENFIDPIIGSDRWPLYNNGRFGFMGCLDHGFRNPTAFYLIAYDNEGRMVVFYEYYHTERLVSENALAILSYINQLGISVDYIVADPSTRNTDPITGTSIQMEYAEVGIYLSMGNNEVKAGIDRMANMLRTNKLFITKDCPKLIWELSRYRWDKFLTGKIAGRNNLKESPIKKDDHGLDAVRYAIMSRPEHGGLASTRVGNILGMPEAIGAKRIDKDVYALEGRLVNQPDDFDYTLGTDW